MYRGVAEKAARHYLACERASLWASLPPVARALATTILLVCGCSEHSRPAPVVGPAPVVKPAPAAAAPPVLELSPAPEAEPAQVSILSPPSGEILSPADPAATPLKIHSSRPDWILELGLDGRRLRPVASLPEQPTLGDLSEGSGVSTGKHILVAALRSSENAPARYALSRFSVELGYSGVQSVVYCGRPSGTYYGAGEPLLLDFFVAHPDVGHPDAVLVRARRLGGAEPAREAKLDSAAPRLLQGLTPGDWSIELELLDADQDPLSRTRCELTVNEVAAP